MMSTVNFFTQAVSPLIPTDISSSCMDFLVDLDAHTDLATCANALLNTTKAFAPGSQPSSTDLANALQGICRSTNTCSESILRTHLMNFNSLSRTDLVQSGNSTLKNIYDVLY